MPRSRSIFFELERLSNESLTEWNNRSSKIKEYVYQNYMYFAQKRSEILSDLFESLRSVSEQFKFNDWQRVVHVKRCLNPLSTQGSILNPAGGRFNIGNINPTIFPPFGALYLAEDRDTAIREKHGLQKNKSASDGLSSHELNLTKKTSEAYYVISGEINFVLNLCNKTSLSSFFKFISKIKHPQHLYNLAKDLKIEPTRSVKTLPELYATIFEENWRSHSFSFNIPANSQILGQIASESGIEAILYPSTKDGKKCLAVFPKNFHCSKSFVKIAPNQAPAEIEPDFLTISKDTYKKFM